MLRAILVDDEEPVLNYMERLLGANGNVEIVGKFIRPEEAIDRVRIEQIDVVFLDIQMPGMTGIEAAEYLMESAPRIDIVFVTAYNQYAVEAFELSAVDYVLKPPTADRLNKTIERLLWRRIARDREGLMERNEASGADEAVRAGFYSFGRFEWIVAAQSGTAAVKWRRSKERELMAYLVHNRNRFVLKEKILDDLWGGTKPEQAANFLHTCVYSIRKKMNSFGLTPMLEYRNSGYRLEMGESWCDADEYERMAGGDMEINSGNIGEFETIAKLYKGNYMEDDGFLWAREAEGKWKDAYVVFMKRMADYYISANKLKSAASCLQSALQRNPFPDDINETILQVYARLGDRQSLIRHYEQFAKLLKEELGIAPMETTVQLFERLCSGSASDITLA
ncbi:response regulator [Cohnella suwonensis]|uniref:Response regulator n=1 Tax=Cohnella suwonensis TaxID=696072 RepID=A0ABW0LZR4_9BACL